jgi:hypothetical protein
VSVADRPQNLRALDNANRIRIEAARQRRALIGAPASELIPAIVNPTPELATYKLASLFGNGTGKSVIDRFGIRQLRRAIADIEQPRGRRWHTELRLRDLSRTERKRLMAAISMRAPKAWSAGQ